MMAWLQDFLARYPELTLFLVISLGYWIGSLKIAGFGLGPVMGALFAGIVIGQFAHVPTSAMTKSFLFLLFLFGIGYSVGLATAAEPTRGTRQLNGCIQRLLPRPLPSEGKGVPTGKDRL
jgi:uncharacterized transporter YbjL